MVGSNADGRIGVGPDMNQSGIVSQNQAGQAVRAPGFDVHVWRIELDAPVSQVHADTLSAAERAKGGRFLFESDQRRYMAGHAALRWVLSLYAGQGPEELDLRETPNGKPILHGSSLAFNLSHSGAIALLAVAAAGQVGVDVQHIRSLPDEMSIARTLFASGEIAHLETLTGDERRLMFFRFWTCREAMLKAAGVGLSGTGLEIGLDAGGTIFVRSPPSGWNAVAMLNELRLGTGCLAAVAWSPRAPQAVVRHFDFKDLALQ